MSVAYRWGDERTIKFVKLYREHENLWNMFSPEYRDRDARSVSFQAIADEINIENFTTKDVPKKIKSLRSTYYQEVTKIGKSKLSGVGIDYEPSLPWFNDMAYIIKRATIKEKKTHSNLELITQETLMNSNTERVFDDDLINVTEPIITLVEQSVRSPTSDKTQLPARLRNKGQKRKFGTITDAVLKELKSLNETLVTVNTASQEDECEIIGKHIVIQLRELSVHDRLQANMKIQKILMDFRLKNINTSPSIVSSDTSHSPASTIPDTIKKER